MMGQSYAVPDDVDEADLMAELDALEGDMLNEEPGAAGAASYLTVSRRRGGEGEFGSGARGAFLLPVCSAVPLSHTHAHQHHPTQHKQKQTQKEPDLPDLPEAPVGAGAALDDELPGLPAVAQRT